MITNRTHDRIVTGLNDELKKSYKANDKLKQELKFYKTFVETIAAQTIHVMDGNYTYTRNTEGEIVSIHTNPVEVK